ncbi:hypothetical protein [Deinococcus yunweiensis]|uniref:hypothetical protein n=1 Tax=Deinococcus yunweiensis TaxID=367282 RepID=UPI00398ECF3E
MDTRVECQLAYEGNRYHGQVVIQRKDSVLSVIALSAGVLALSSLTMPPVPQLLMMSEKCDPTPEFKVVMDPYGGIKRANEGWTWLSQGYIEMHPCYGGILKISGYGNYVGDDWPNLIASLDEKGLGSWVFDKYKTLVISIPQGGRISLAFLNAYYKADTHPIQRRELYLDYIAFKKVN